MVKFKEVKVSSIRKGGNHILVADIGGTHCNFALFQIEGVKHLISLEFKSKDITNFADVVNQVLGHLLDKYTISIKNACFAPAGVVSRDHSTGTITNLKWNIDSKKLIRQTPLKFVYLINDFEAIAFGIDAIKKNDIIKINKNKPIPFAPRAVLGAGTGLGKNILTYDKLLHQYLPIPCEGGHGNLPVINKEEFALLRYIQDMNNKPTVSWESVLSGKGIQTIYQFLEKKGSLTKIQKEIKDSGYDPKLISKNKSKDPLCRKTFAWFTKFYARCSKNLALEALALNGVYIAGGIAAKNLSIFKKKVFMQEFLETDRLGRVLKQIPIYVIKNYNVSLYGAVVAAMLHKEGKLL